MSRAYDLAVESVRWLYDQRIAGTPVLDGATFFPNAGQFADAWPALRDEAIQASASLKRIPRFHDLMPEQAEISANDERDWRLLVLKAYGVAVPENMARCPVLARLIESNPDVLSAALSILAPRKHIPLHRGPFRGITRFYMGLSVPIATDGSPAVVLKIDGIEHRIADGQFLVWDDTFPHEVWNNSDEIRIALLLDVRRHGMPYDMELLSWLLIAGIKMSIKMGSQTWYQ